VWAQTDANGNFTIHNAPSGANIPLVMQSGKWRRQIPIPKVDACTDNPQLDKNMMRLPRNQHEGDMPKIAFVSGSADIAECALGHYGIDEAEFTPPGGSGSIDFYTGWAASTIAGGNTYDNTMHWWTDKNTYSSTISCQSATRPQRVRRRVRRDA
jgi:hypothetical protein